MDDKRSRPRLLTLALAGALALRVAYVLSLPNTPPTWRDSRHYIAIATSLIREGRYEDTVGRFSGEPMFSDQGPTAFWLPGYPLLAALIMITFGDSPRALMLTNAVLGSATVFFVFRVGRALFGPASAYFGALLAALSPSLLYYVGSIGTETLVALCLVWALDGFVVSRKAWTDDATTPSARWWSSVALGFPLLAGALTRTLLLPVGLVLLASLGRAVHVRFGSLRRAIQACLLPAAIVVLGLAPWLIRNYLVFGEVIYEGKVGLNMAVGFNDQADGTFSFRGVPDFDASKFTELQRDHLYMRLASTWISEHPGRSLLLIARKLTLFWNPVPALRGGIVAMGGTAWTLCFLVLAAMGLFLTYRRRAGSRVITYATLAYVLPISLAFSITRFRVPLEAVLAIPAGAAVDHLVHLVPRWRQTRAR
jgi:Dolichyl-phosphate-mannose-protein mannosyltransferase